MLKPDGGHSATLTEGIEAFRNGNLEKSKSAFNKIIDTQRGSPELEEAQWYLAQIAEKQGKRNEAQQQYNFFLKNYPSSPHTTETKKRLSALTKTLAFTSNSPSAKEPPAPIVRDLPLRRPAETSRFGKLAGGLTTEYVYDLQTSPKLSTPVQSRLSEFLDLRWKRPAAGDIKIYLSGMYSHNYLDSEDTRYRLSKLYAEWNDPRSVLDIRLGRQPASGNTLFTRFDGIAVAVRPFNTLGFNSSVGYPVNTFDKNKIRIQHDRLFYDSYLSLYDFYHLGGKIYYTEEFESIPSLDISFLTRRAVGINGYWLNEPLNISSIVDYDLDFKKFNDELLSLEYRYSIVLYSVAVEYRKNPFLDYHTALLDPSLSAADPPITSLDVLRQTLTRKDIQNLALDNTTDSRELRLGTTIDFTKVWRGDFRYSHVIGEAIDFIDGKIGKRSDRYSVFFSERNGLKWSESWTVLFLYLPATDFKTTTVTSTFSKFWGIGTQASLRCRWERIEFITTDSRSMRWIPGFTLSYSFTNGTSIGLDADYSIDKNITAGDTQKTVETRTTVTIPF
ncbi:MAG: tetratricopeptide repeat protein [Nitrospirae bacterium]|nr:tetratricopeptide repeat protein [Nitrospirota bacterium]